MSLDSLSITETHLKVALSSAMGVRVVLKISNASRCSGFTLPTAVVLLHTHARPLTMLSSRRNISKSAHSIQ